jgi:hypothetical protein
MDEMNERGGEGRRCVQVHSICPPPPSAPPPVALFGASQNFWQKQQNQTQPEDNLKDNHCPSPSQTNIPHQMWQRTSFPEANSNSPRPLGIEGVWMNNLFKTHHQIL